MEAAECAPMRNRNIVLDEVSLQPRFSVTALVPGLQEKTARIGENIGLKYEQPSKFATNYIHGDLCLEAGPLLLAKPLRLGNNLVCQIFSIFAPGHLLSQTLEHVE